MKKVGSVLATGCVLLSLAGCDNSNKTWITEYNGEKTKVGVYIQYLMSEYRQLYMQDLMGKLKLTENEKNNAADEKSSSKSNSEVTEPKNSSEKEKKVSPLKKFIEDEDTGKWILGNQWVVNKAKKDLEEDIAVDTKFKEMKLALDQETVDYLERKISEQWDTVNEQQGYEEKGVSQDSVIYALKTQLKRQQIFNAYYDKGGIKEVSESEIKSYLADNYNQVKYYRFEVHSMDEEKKEKIKKLYNDFLTRAKSGNDIDKLIEEFRAKRKDAEEKDSVNSETSGYNKDSDDNSEKLSVYKKDDTSVFNEDVRSAIDKAKMNELTGFKGENEYIIFIKQDPSKNEDYIKNNRISLLSEMKDDDFHKEIFTWIDKKSIKYNDKALNKYYTPSKLKLDKKSV